MAKNSKVGHFRGNDSYKGSSLSICIYKKIYLCIVVAQDFQVSNSGSWEPLVLEPPWNPPLKNFWIRAWITVKNRSLLITGIISPVGVLVTFMKDQSRAVTQE
jgi:hypothetical protein